MILCEIHANVVCSSGRSDPRDEERAREGKGGNQDHVLCYVYGKPPNSGHWCLLFKFETLELTLQKHVLIREGLRGGP